MFTTMYHVVLFMSYTHTKIEQYFLCVSLILVLEHLEKCTHGMSLCYLKLQYQNFTTNNIFQKLKNWHLVFHICVLLKRIIVENNTTRNLNVRSNSILFYD